MGAAKRGGMPQLAGIDIEFQRFQVLLDKSSATLNARQFGLKLLANVTYGYTAASFSGRMPCAELADAIVQVVVLVLVAIITLILLTFDCRLGARAWRCA
jgi:hypothetical protein